MPASDLEAGDYYGKPVQGSKQPQRVIGLGYKTRFLQGNRVLETSGY
jgi:hypothetical protein